MNGVRSRILSCGFKGWRNIILRLDNHCYPCRMTITKADLAAAIVAQTDLHTALAAECVQHILNGMVDALVQGEKVEIRGFGSFRIRQRDPYDGRNPSTGEPVAVPPRRVANFTPGKELNGGVR